MLLAIDIGNSYISCGIINIETSIPSLVLSFRIASGVKRSSDEYGVLFNQILNQSGLDASCITCSAVSSVVPNLTDEILSAAHYFSSSNPFIIGPGTKTGFKIDIYNPGDLGSDIVANAAGAYLYVKPPFVVFDAGTANTLTYVDKDNRLVGTVIAPGLGISFEALSANAEMLKRTVINSSDIPLLGRNTDESVRSGIILGTASMIDGFIRNIREKYVHKEDSEKLGLVATGGNCEIITNHTRNKFNIQKSLTLLGISVLYIRNYYMV